MANRTLSRLLLTAFGVSLLAGAGQLGLAFGFGIVRLTGAFSGATVNQWPAQLVWVGWFAANAAVIGAVLTERTARQDRQLTGTGRQLAVAGSAALGATVVAPLCMQPARNAELISVDPVWAVAICAVLGAIVGAGAALAVLVRPPFAWNMAAVAGAVWLIALLSVVPSLGASGPLTPVRLGVLEPVWFSADTAQRLALLVLPMTTLLAGVAGGWAARWRGHPPLVSGPSGVAGPVLVAFAYLAAGPGDSADRYQLAPYYGALIAIAVGALGSTAAALLPWPLTGRSRPDTQAIEPTAILQPLPPTPALPTSPSRPTGQQPADPPPHWQWPDQRTSSLPTAAGAAPTRPDTPSLSAPASSGPAEHTTVGAEDTSPAATEKSVDAPPTTAGAGLDAQELSAADDRHPAPAPTGRTSAAAAPAPADAATTTGEPLRPDAPASAETPATPDDAELAVDPAPVGDGSDIPRAGRTARSPRAAARPSTPGPASPSDPTSGQAPTPGQASPSDPAPASGPLADPASAGKTPTPRRTRKPRTSTTAVGSAQPSEDGQAPAPTLHQPAHVVPDANLAVPDTAPPADTRSATAEPAADTQPAAAPPAADTQPVAHTTGSPWPTGGTGGSAATVRPEPTPRPRHRLSLPELNAAASWNAFAPTRPADPQPGDEKTGAAQEGPAAGGPTAVEPPTPIGRGGTDPAPPTGPAAAPTGPAATSPAGLDPASPAGLDPVTTAREVSAAFAAAPSLSSDPAATARDLSAAFTKPPAVAPEDVQPSGERDKGLRGLFRRGKPRPDNTEGGEEPLPAQDEEYVDWVTGLGRPVADDEPEPKKSRRSLRSTGRHHRD
ncbi:hypothetical protein JMF97_16565 [Micromonospora fiedleri]|uniref:Uncharacterized protein n=1 Tax=Micromonospora fiedleri TaxID=1157498 RepID=A0ABS1UN38_9ACTN|nr:hypothetical protein [Micromonospora fiedleri]MBL6277773.1 hypothetical protein [Micromonospora fiedleri]